MKKLAYLILSLVFFLGWPTQTFGSNSKSRTVSLKKQSGHTQQMDREGMRCPARNLICVITEDEFISEIDSNSIESFEIWDEEGQLCLLTSPDVIDFCNFLWINVDNYQIRIVTNEEIYIGYF